MFRPYYNGHLQASILGGAINVSVGIQSNTTCYSFSNGVYYTLGDMFRPYYNGHLQASILGGVVNTIVIRNIRDLISRAKSTVYYHDSDDDDDDDG
jgi:hypothetical protein